MHASMYAWALLVADPAPTAEEKPYTIQTATEPAALAGVQEGTFVIGIVPAAGWAQKKETPYKVEVTSGEGLELAKKAFAGEDLQEPRSEQGPKTLPIAFRVKGPGKYSLEAKLSFFLCTPQVCQRFLETVKGDVTIAPAKK